MSKKQVIKPLLTNLHKVGFATPYNFIPFITNNPKNLKCAEGWPRDVFKRLLKQKLIREIPIYSRIYKPTLKDTFYTPTDLGCKSIERDRVYIDSRSYGHLDHEFALTDILLSFIYGYPDYEVEINRNYVFKDIKYKPDAHVRMTDKDGKIYDFIIEFERTRSWQQIKDEKFKKISPEKYGLLHFTQFLFIYTWERFNVYWRPIQYPTFTRELETTNKQFKKFTAYTKNLKPNFLFTRLHDLIANKQNATWFSPQGKPRKLI